MSSHFLPGEKRNIRTALCTQNVSLQQGHSEGRQRGHSSGRLGLILNLEGGAERKETLCCFVGHQAPDHSLLLSLQRPRPRGQGAAARVPRGPALGLPAARPSSGPGRCLRLTKQRREKKWKHYREKSLRSSYETRKLCYSWFCSKMLPGKDWLTEKPQLHFFPCSGDTSFQCSCFLQGSQIIALFWITTVCFFFFSILTCNYWF